MSVSHSDLGSRRIPRVVEDIAEGSRNTVKRARRCDPLDFMDLTQPQRHAAVIYRQAVQHIQAGVGMGPLPWGRDNRNSGPYSGLSLGPQERALSAAEWHRRASLAVPVACQPNGVLSVVVIGEWSLTRYDRWREWREGRGMRELRAALDACAKVFGTI